MIDSGAFTAWTKGLDVDVDEYINRMNQLDDVVDYYIQLDKIPGRKGTPPTAQERKDAEIATRDNFLYMESKAISPHKLLPVFHQGDSWSLLREFLTHRRPDGALIDYICISHSKERRMQKGQADWFLDVYDLIRTFNPTVKVHVLGLGQPKTARKNPWFNSMDSTTYV